MAAGACCASNVFNSMLAPTLWLLTILVGVQAQEASPGATMLHDRLHALQKIVNASVYAMRTDDPTSDATAD